MVTHGAASDPFWAAIKEGADRGAADAGVDLVYRAPETFDLEQMAALVAAAVEEEPDGLIVSIPNADAVAAPIRAAVDAGIPVITINSGFDVAQSLGALLHVGQSEYEAGRVAGDAMRKARRDEGALPQPRARQCRARPPLQGLHRRLRRIGGGAAGRSQSGRGRQKPSARSWPRIRRSIRFWR